MKSAFRLKQTLLRVGCFIAFNLQLFTIVTFGQIRTDPEIDSIAQRFVSEHMFHGSNSHLNIRKLYKSSEIFTSYNALSEDLFKIYEVKDSDSPNGQNGFVIVSSNKRLPEIIGYSETSNFNVNNLPPAFKYWLNTFEEAIEETTPINLSSGINPEGVAPLLGETKWGQGVPYNNMCPAIGRERCVTGCVATAMAQVMNYYKYPDCGTGNISYRTRTKNLNINVNLGNYPFAWGDILPSYSKNYSNAQASAVTTLMFCCGASVKMDYGIDASGAYQNDLLPAYINNYGYDKDAAFVLRDLCDTENWHNILIEELNEGRPVNYAGSNKTDGGHSFIIDGYRVEDRTQRPFYHLNWGWDGMCDGYYQIANLHPQENSQYGTTQGFNSGQEMVIGVMPDDGENHGDFMICTTGVRTSKKAIKPDNPFTVTVNSIYNLSLPTFSGVITAVIKGNEDDEIVIGTTAIKNIKFMNSESNLTINVSIPAGTKDGEYRIELRSKPSEKSKYTKVFSASYPTLTVSNNGKEEQASEEKVELCASDMDVVLQNDDLSRINSKAYILKNVSLEAFVGKVSLAIINSKGDFINTFGNSVSIPEIGYMEIISSPVKLSGYLPDNLDEGVYILGLAAKRNSKEDYSVVGYAENINSKPFDSTPIGLPMEVKNDKVIINGIEFKRKQVSCIDNVYNEFDQNFKLFDVQGNCICVADSFSSITTLNLHPGIYILSRKDGERKKIIVK